MLAWGLVVQTQAATNFVTTVADTGPGSLRQVIADATPGDVVAFGVTGTITLSSGRIGISNNLSIIGQGPTTLSIGGGFSISPSTTVSISGVTLSGGHAADGANGIRIDPLTITSGGPGESGGAIQNAGNLILVDCRLSNNSAGNGGNGTTYQNSPGGSAGGAGGQGGAIYSTGTLSLTNCTIENNAAGSGGASGAILYGPTGGAGGAGGGIYSLGTLRMHNCLVRSNTSGSGGGTPVEASGASGGDGAGVASGGYFIATGSTFCNNFAGAGGRGGGDSGNAGAGGAGGSGGGLYLQTSASLTNCTIAGNTAGAGGAGGDSYLGTPGNGGAGGDGGALLATGALSLMNCTTCSNATGTGGTGGYRAPNQYFPFPLYGATGTTGLCGGLSYPSGTGAQLLNTIVTDNNGINPNVSGALTSLGHNLIGATNGSIAFTNAGDLVGSLTAPLEAKLGSLADNGGTTPTVALLPGSPALDTGATAGAPLVDQRGMVRPHGRGVDIGAFEVQFDLPFIHAISMAPTGSCTLKIWGLPNQSCTIEQSTNLLDWDPVTTQQTDASGVLAHTNSPNRDFNFYRVHISPN